MTINIANIYPDFLNMDGEKGNLSGLLYRMNKMGINSCVTDYAIGDKIDFEKTNIVYIGGGSEKDQVTAMKNLMQDSESFKRYVEDGGCVLAVCSGYEILGKSFYADGKKYDGLGILNLEFESKKSRMIGEIILESPVTNGKIVGFENHGGYVSDSEYEPLGNVISGFGSCNSSKKEGVVYKKLIGTYIHGPLLPLNPDLTDHIIKLASDISDEDFKINNSYEEMARSYILGKTQN